MNEEIREYQKTVTDTIKKNIETVRRLLRPMVPSGEEKEIDSSFVAVSSSNHTNVVSQEILRKVQSSTLKQLKEYLSKTFGPMGSNTKIITGNTNSTIQSAYSKDGLKVLKQIVNSGPIEMSIIEEIIEATRHVESEVGDGTTSTVMLASIIFDNLMKVANHFNVSPYQLIRDFKATVEEIKKIIMDHKKECTLEDIYDICMVSTNGNEEVSQNIVNIYEEYGMDVELNVGISNTSDSILRAYDGLMITEGMSDPAYINNTKDGTCEIHKAIVYHFEDPIDDMNMISLFEAIINFNIYERLQDNLDPIPTVITCPRISKDMSGILKHLTQQLYQYNSAGAENQKPPILVITNVVGSDEAIMDDIATLCSCKTIRKYIDPKMLQRDQEDGNAPTIENVSTFGGFCELVVADSRKTKFINPDHMTAEKKENDQIYNSLVHFLETEIENTKSEESAVTVGILKKRLSALKSNMVEYLVGGITIQDRDTLKDLIEDATKNCRSAAKNGVGRAANYEGLLASYQVFNITNMNIDMCIKDSNFEEIYKVSLAWSIFDAYFNISKILYSTVEMSPSRVEEIVFDTLIKFNGPINITKGYIPRIESDDTYAEDFQVKCSIMIDINILDTLSKIITVMVTCNQCLLQSPSLNNY